MKATINGAEMHYEVHGDGSHAVLCIHGFPLSGEMWSSFVKEFDDSEARVIVPDLRGFGQSQPVDETSIEQYAEDLAALLDEVGVRDSVVLMGLSMGGYIAFEFYRRWPERVAAMVLVDTRAEADTPEAAGHREADAARVLEEGAGVVAGPMREKLFSPRTSADLKDKWHNIMLKTPQAGMAAAMRAMARRPDSTGMLPMLDIPVLIVVGEDDAITPLPLAESMQASIPGARLTTIPAAGHLTPVEQPEAFAQTVRRFLGSLVAAHV